MTSPAGAYRATEALLPPRVADVVWRQRVSRAARVLFWTWVGRAALVVVLPVITLFDTQHAVQIYRVGYAIPGVIGAVACWLLTARRPGRRSMGSAILGIAVRTLATLTVGLTVVGLFASPDYRTTAGRMLLYLLWAVSICSPVTQLLYFRSLFVEVGSRRSARFALVLAAVFGVLEAVSAALSSWFVIQLTLGSRVSLYGLQLVCWVVPVVSGAALIRRLSRALSLVQHEWWFNEHVGWASVGCGGDGPSEIVEASGERRLIESWDGARDWLMRAGYVDEHRALAERLVMGVPARIPLASAQRMRPSVT